MTVRALTYAVSDARGAHVATEAPTIAWAAAAFSATGTYTRAWPAGASPGVGVALASTAVGCQSLVGADSLRAQFRRGVGPSCPFAAAASGGLPSDSVDCGGGCNRELLTARTLDFTHENNRQRRAAYSFVLICQRSAAFM